MYDNKSISWFAFIGVFTDIICCDVPRNLASCISVPQVKKSCGAPFYIVKKQSRGPEEL